MSDWRLAEGLKRLLAQVNEAAPNRSKGWDGTIGDAAHSARKSDHNPDEDGVVKALDVTHDPAHGVDGQKIRDGLIASRDDRIQYIIWNRAITSGRGGPSPWTARPYTGSNPHDHHVHVSIRKDSEDDERDWQLVSAEGPIIVHLPDVPPAQDRPLLVRGSKGSAVEDLQRLLNAQGASPQLDVDGDFGDETFKAVKKFQKDNSLDPDGKVGGYTWSKLEPEKPRVRSNKWYGCRPSIKDARDTVYKPRVTKLPTCVDLRDLCPPHMNQGDLGSCVAHGITAVMRYTMNKKLKATSPLVAPELARLQLYYDGRVVEDCVNEDTGLEIRDGMKCASKLGVAHESMWGYDIARFMERPAPGVYLDAERMQIVSFRRVPVNATSVKSAIARGFPVIIGVTLYDSFESDVVAESGVVPMPDLDSEGIVGGHCMYVPAYGQRKGHFTTRNSWGNDWGDGGDCYFPYEYIGNPEYGSDYWIVEDVETY